MKLIFASQNQHKFEEIRSRLTSIIELVNLNELHFLKEIPETGATLEENALEKAYFIHTLFQENTFADDTGLEVEALNGRPGIYSARFAGDKKNSVDNMNKLLAELKGVTNRRARFRTVIALIINGQKKIFEGIAEGDILTHKIGIGGFGYDPIFKPKGYKKSFAEMTLTQKNQISHRSQAFDKLVDYLNSMGK